MSENNMTNRPNENTPQYGMPANIPQYCASGNTPQYCTPDIKPQTKQTESLKKHFGTLGLASFLYACFYALCMYRNGSGITYPFFLAGSLWFYCFCMKKLGISLKKDSIFYVISILLLGISTFCTADNRIIFMNKTGIWVLTISFLLHQFFDDRNWTFGRYTGYVIAAVFGSLGEIARPFTDMAAYRRMKGKKEKSTALYIVIGLCIGIPVFFIVWLLLISADMIFFHMMETLFYSFNFADIFGVIFTVILMFFMCYCIMAFLCKKPFSEEYRARMQAESALAVTIALPLTLLYLVFSGIQIVCLFLGNINLENYTYAEYARQGFFQLLIVCVINLILVLCGRSYFKESVFLKILLTIMSLCTYIMIASSAFRMILYVKHYYLTFLRIFVLWSLVVLFILLTGVIISIYKSRFPLFHYSMAVVTICYLLLSFAHPDYFIAKCSIANMGSSVSDFFDADAYEDYYYLTQLSEDAAPAFAEFFKEEGFSMEVAAKGAAMSGNADDGNIYDSRWDSRYELYGGYRSDEESWGYYYLQKVYQRYQEMGIRDFNLSKYMAYQAVK